MLTVSINLLPASKNSSLFALITIDLRCLECFVILQSNYNKTYNTITNSLKNNKTILVVLLNLQLYPYCEVYEIIHICTAVVDEVKCDHRSKFSNLSNWKGEA